MIKNENIENPSQKMILLSDNMVDYIVRHMCWAVEGGQRYRNTLYNVRNKSFSWRFCDSEADVNTPTESLLCKVANAHQQ